MKRQTRGKKKQGETADELGRKEQKYQVVGE
jgi:hypothetical protein